LVSMMRQRASKFPVGEFSCILSVMQDGRKRNARIVIQSVAKGLDGIKEWMFPRFFTSLRFILNDNMFVIIIFIFIYMG